MDVILIGGAPLTGKSTLAKKLSLETGFKIISGDNIRNQMLNQYNKEEYPNLFFFNDWEVVDFYQKHTAKEVLQAEINRHYVVEEGVKEYLATNYENVIIEGIVITPSFLVNLKNSYYFKDYEFKDIFLYQNNYDDILKRIRQRGLWTSAQEYPDDVKLKEAEVVMLYNQWYLNQAEKFRFGTIKI